MKRKITRILAFMLAFMMIGGALASCNPPAEGNGDGGDSTLGPVTNAPETNAPETNVPETNAPESNTPESNTPETNAPETNAPESNTPESNTPETNAPETNAPETNAPESNTPETNAPETNAPETNAPETNAPETNAPETNAPETNAPETNAPETNAPETNEPETNEPEETTPSASGSNSALAPSILYANQLVNGVQSYYTEANRNVYRVENKHMNLEFSLNNSKLPTSLTNKNGGVYIENTMDVFVKMEGGDRVFASESVRNARPNIYRLGYYYYDVHFLDQDFLGKREIINTKRYNPNLFTGLRNVTNFNTRGDDFTLNANPGGYIYAPIAAFSHNASDYNAVTFKIRAKNLSGVKMYYIAGGNDTEGHIEAQSVEISVNSDGENFYDCIVMLSEGQDYNGKVTALRMDFKGIKDNEFVEVQDIKLAKVETKGPSLYLDRTFHTYSDKLHQELHVIATKEVTGIEEIGMITRVEAGRVAALLVKDGAGQHSTIDGVNWATAEYVGFDIKDAGIFGYILPNHKDAGSITVELVDGYYVITQITRPEGGKILPINGKNTYTDNDFFTGQRLYTDETHSFVNFIREAEFERKPLGREIGSDTFLGYEAFKGSYRFEISGTGFNSPFFYDHNHYYNISAKLRSSVDRPIYIRTYANTGCLENAAILDGNDLLVPINPEVSKNFGGEDEEPLYNSGDHEYGETLFPILLPANQRIEIKVLNLYQNWGKYPLKQLSSIQYFWPYYHLSVGTTETSCISPWYGARDLWTLPDFRSQSMPYWYELEHDKGYSNQPQHTHAGYQYFLQYTDADGNYNATENISNVINSSGPIYADVDMTYISDDNKIKVVYKHLEMPQYDELRAYYEIEYEILDEITIDDFRNKFSFYSFEGYAGKYTKMGYLDENGNHVHKATNQTDTPELIKLGKESPYVSLYALQTGDPKSSWTYNNANLGMIIYNSEFIFDGKECTENFVVTGANAKYSLSLDIDSVTLKPGDTMKLNMIVMPWGHYDTEDDASVRNVRENTCLDALGVDVIKGEKMESVFLPKLRTDDGKSAEFTVHGGTDNVVVRVYGFEKHTAPKIYVKDGDNWVDYVVNSIDTPDKMGNRHYYDGYFAYYDEDGTYSYAFVIDADEYKNRTFRIDASEDFNRWPTVTESGGSTLLNVYQPSFNLFAITNGYIKGISKTELSTDGSYVRYYGDGLGTGEAYFEVYRNNTTNTGRYIVLKYRIPTTNKSLNRFEFFTSTSTDVSMTECAVSAGTTYNDDGWHVMIVDTVGKEHPYFNVDEDGKSYLAKYLRLDIFNTAMTTNCYVDIAYIGMTDDISKVYTVEMMQNDPCETVTVYSKDNAYVTYDLQGNEVAKGDSAPGTSGTVGRVEYVHPENAQGYIQSTTPYISGIDFINGKGDGDPNHLAFNSYISSNEAGVKEIIYNGATHGNAYLAMAGWTLVYEGVEKYVWSADGGKTWHDAVLYPDTKAFGAATDENGIKVMGDNHFTNHVTGFDKDTYNQDYYANSVYQGGANTPTGIAAHLEDYVGTATEPNEVNVTFAAVPKNDSKGLVIIASVQKVRVYANDADAAEGERCKHTDIEQFVFIDDGDPNTEKAIVQKKCRCGEVIIETGIPNYVLFIGNFGDVNVAPTAPDHTKEYMIIDAKNNLVGGASKNFAANDKGELTVNGWAGLNSGIKDIVFKVFDADGNELTSGWTSTNPTLSTRLDIGGEMIKRNIAVADGKGVNFTIHLERYIKAKNDVVTVKLAFVAAGATEGITDKYVYICDITNVEVPADPVEYEEPSVPGGDGNYGSYIDPENTNGYTKSDTPYVSGIDFINGLGDGDVVNPSFDGYRSSGTLGVKVIKWDSTTFDNAYLAIAGWTVVYEGIEKFVWSADGGKTWHDAVLYPDNRALGTAAGGIKDAGDAEFGKTVIDFNKDTYNQEYYANSVYQGGANSPTGIAAHLTGYIGKEVNVTFAAVPKNDTDGLVIIAHIEKVRVYESNAAAEEGEPCTHTKAVSYEFIGDNDPNTETALIVRKCKCGQVVGTATVPSYVLFIGNIGGVGVAPTAPDHNKGYITIDATNHVVSGVTKTFAANGNGDLTIDGWTGLNGGIADIVFKVFDANGNELTGGWTSTKTTLVSRGDIAAEMTKRGIETNYGRGFAFTLHLSRYIKAKNDVVTVKLAFVATGAPANSNDKYVDICEITNVLVPAEPSDYFEPVVPEASDKVFITYFDSFTGNNSIAVKDSTTSKVYIYDCSSITSKGNASIALAGWAGVYGGASAVAYKITTKDGSSDWVFLNRVLTDAESDVEGAVQGGQPTIAAEHAYRYTIDVDLRNYIGSTVSVTFALVSTDDGTFIPFFMANNLKVICDHTTVDPNSDYTFIGDDDENTDEAKIAAKCICGQQASAQTPSYVFYFQDVFGETTVSASFSSCENSKGFRTYNCNDYSLKAKADGSFGINGWGGVNGGCSKIVLKVYDASGNELTNGWTDFEGGEVNSAINEAGIVGEMTKRGIDGSVAARYHNLTVDLSGYFAQSSTVTVKLAMYCDGAPENSNDKYIYLCDITNLTKAQ